MFLNQAAEDFFVKPRDGTRVGTGKPWFLTKFGTRVIQIKTRVGTGTGKPGFSHGFWNPGFEILTF